MSKLDRNKITIYTLIALMVVVYILGLFIDVTRDGAKYAYIAKEMSETGNWIRLQIQGEPYEQKPHLTFWLSALSFVVLGVSNFSFKLPLLLYTFIGIYATFRLGRAMYSKKVGQTAALMLFFSVIMDLYNMDIHTDIVLFTNVALSLWLLYEFLQKDKAKYAIAAGVTMGLALLTKGPFGVVIPFFAVAGYLIFNKRIKDVFRPIWILVIIIAFAVASPAMINMYSQWGWKGIGFFFWGNNMSRITSKVISYTPDPTFYIHSLLYLFLPWAFILFAGAYLSINKIIKRKLTTPDNFLVWSFWIVFVIFSASRSKLPNYIISLLPIIAILSAETWHRYFDQDKWTAFTKRLSKFQTAAIIAVWITALAILTFLFPPRNPIFWIVPLLLLLASIWILKPMTVERKLFWRSCIAIAALSFVLDGHVYPLLFGQQAQPQAAKLLNEKVEDGEQVYNFNVIIADTKVNNNIDPRSGKPLLHERHAALNYCLMFYSDNYIEDITSYEELDSIKDKRGIWIYADQDGAKVIDSLNCFDEKYTFNHLNLRYAGHYVNPWSRDSAMLHEFVYHSFSYPLECKATDSPDIE